MNERISVVSICHIGPWSQNRLHQSCLAQHFDLDQPDVFDITEDDCQLACAGNGEHHR